MDSNKPLSKSAKKRLRQAKPKTTQPNPSEKPEQLLAGSPTGPLTDATNASSPQSESPRSSGSTNNTVAISCTNPSLRVGDMVARPGYGTIGKRVKVSANVYRMHFQPISIHQYNVEIKPVAQPYRGRGRRSQQPPGRVKREVVELVLKKLITSTSLPRGALPAGAVVDGMKNLYIPIEKIPSFNHRITVMVEDKSKSFDVAVSYAATLNTRDFEAYSKGQIKDCPSAVAASLDVALRHVASMQESNVALGRSIFKLDELAKWIAPGIQVWAGFAQSVYPCQSGWVMNMSTCFTPMVNCGDSVARFIGDFVSFKERKKIPIEQMHRILDDNRYAMIASKIDNLKAKTTHREKELHIKIAGFMKGTSNSTFFEYKGRRVSVAEYLFREYNIRIRYPDLRLVKFYKGKGISKNAFPPEFVQIRKTVYKKPLAPVQKEALIKAATLSPDVKKASIERYHKTQLGNPIHRNLLERWGLKIEDQMLRFDARVLPSPALEGGDQTCIKVNGKGEWDVTAHKFKNAVNLKSWAVVNFCQPPPNTLGPFLDQLINMMEELGMQVKRPPLLQRTLGNDFSNRFHLNRILIEAMNEAGKKLGAPCQMVLVIVPVFDTVIGRERITYEDVYKELKIAADQRVGVLTQCIMSSNPCLNEETKSNARRASLGNICLKMNQKLGGIASILYTLPGELPVFKFPKLEDRPFIALGADLTHPSRDAEDKRSFVGIVGSMNRQASRYACRFLSQLLDPEKGREVIRELKEPVKDLLLAFYKENNQCRPEVILFYRDGVSQGEFAKVVEYEYKAIQQACAEMGNGEYRPAITFITCQKRHRRNLFPEDDNRDKSGNVLPGTVVDRHICHPFGFDFYLNSHAGIQGTSRCALYSVLVDEVGFDADSLQLLTYWLCHLYGRSTNSVSYCAPAYHAHHAASRCKTLMGNQIQRQNFNVVHENLLNETFFM